MECGKASELSVSARSNCVLCHAEFQKARNEDLTVRFGKSEVIDPLDKCGFRGVGRRLPEVSGSQRSGGQGSVAKMGSREVKWQQEGEVGPESLFPCEDG